MLRLSLKRYGDVIETRQLPRWLRSGPLSYEPWGNDCSERTTLDLLANMCDAGV